MSQNTESNLETNIELSMQANINGTNTCGCSFGQTGVNLPDPIDMDRVLSLSELKPSSDDNNLIPVVNIRPGCYLIRFTPISNVNPSLVDSL